MEYKGQSLVLYTCIQAEMLVGRGFGAVGYRQKKKVPDKSGTLIFSAFQRSYFFFAAFLAAFFFGAAFFAAFLAAFS
ncbi:hypothetical protein [Paraflavitalea speifideaquila]|uniref:hypothetical protein n=1 Tax=Paraflavitalea speifideaquila TaxID=3076558 RepID=UPI0028E41374|nr:hypothetical protein [Paraflavitalea speifideiaquila]